VEIPSCPHNALLEILSRNHARVVPDGFLRDLPVSMPANGFLNHPESFMKIADAVFKKTITYFIIGTFYRFSLKKMGDVLIRCNIKLRVSIPQLYLILIRLFSP